MYIKIIIFYWEQALVVYRLGISSDKPPKTIRGLILIDVLPSLDCFPRRKRIAHRLLKHIPHPVGQQIYDFIRYQQGYEAKDLKQILERLESIYAHFPNQIPNIPVLILSTNQHFHEEWSQMAKKYPLLTAELSTDLSGQITTWLRSFSTR